MGGSEWTADVSAQVSELLQVDLQVLVSSVQQQLQRLTAIKQEVHHLRLRQLRVRQRQAFCRRYQHRLQKVVKLREQQAVLSRCPAVLLSCCPSTELLVSFRPCRTWTASPSCWTPARWWTWAQTCTPPGCCSASAGPDHISP